jgi:hypothetical protein
MSDPHARQKCDQLRAMLDEGLVMIHLDPRPADVVVPAQFKSQPMLRLNLAWGFNLPALDIDEAGVYAVLSFNRSNFGCTIPWSAVFAMTWPDLEHDGYVWPDSAPAEIRAAMALAQPVPEAAAPLPPSEPEPESEPPVRPILIVHEGGRAKDDAAPTPPPGDAPAERPRLRLVKG